MHETEIRRRMRVVNQGLHNQFRAGAVAPGVVERLYRTQFQLERDLGEITGRRRLHLVCGHTRTIDVNTFEENDMLRTGVVQCRAIKEAIGWPAHRMAHIGVLGWSRLTDEEWWALR